uniref:Uncharacterized protein n=1 Tax=Pararge aegeria TaxID=116150 RepID=S4NPT4_9NEOP
MLVHIITRWRSWHSVDRLLCQHGSFVWSHRLLIHEKLHFNYRAVCATSFVCSDTLNKVNYTKFGLERNY